MHLVQLRDRTEARRVAMVDGALLRLIDGCASVHALAMSALSSGMPLANVVETRVSGETLDYDEIYALQSEWTLLPAFDHPGEPARCMVAGTGLTHKASALNRAAMHKKSDELTDSMKMYQMGIEGGSPAPGAIGVAPEWFYKGCGTVLRAHGEPLVVPTFGEDGGEEPEIAGAYVIDSDRRPRRVGMMVGNEFSDHVMEKRSYLYLAPSKLRNCSVGPELVVDAGFDNVAGTVSIERAGEEIWSKAVATGEQNMSHSLANLEHHHFKYEAHRRPGDAHVHFFGASAFSFGDGLSLAEGDVMSVAFAGFGRALRNPIRFDHSEKRLVRVEAV